MKYLLIILIVLNSNFILAKDKKEQLPANSVRVYVSDMEQYNDIMRMNPSLTEDKGVLGCRVGLAAIGNVVYGNYSENGEWKYEVVDNRVFKDIYWKEGTLELPYMIKRRAERQFVKTVERFKTLDIFWGTLNYLASMTDNSAIKVVLANFGRLVGGVDKRETIKEKLLKDTVDNILYLQNPLFKYRTDCMLLYGFNKAEEFGVFKNYGREGRNADIVKMLMHNLKKMTTYNEKYEFLSTELKKLITIF